MIIGSLSWPLWCLGASFSWVICGGRGSAVSDALVEDTKVFVIFMFILGSAMYALYKFAVWRRRDK